MGSGWSQMQQIQLLSHNCGFAASAHTFVVAELGTSAGGQLCSAAVQAGVGGLRQMQRNEILLCRKPWRHHTVAMQELVVASAKVAPPMLKHPLAAYSAGMLLL